MNKWIVIPAIAVLAVGIIGGGYFFWQQTNKLTEAESEIVALEGNVSTLEGNVATLEGNVATLETNMADSEATVSTLETDLEAANAEIDGLQVDVSAQQNINSALSAELKTVKDPRHFASLQELTDWLRKDDTDTKYAYASVVEVSFILQVRALRDGYILPAILYERDGSRYVMNQALIGDEIYRVAASDDDSYFWENEGPVPLHPLPLD